MSTNRQSVSRRLGLRCGELVEVRGREEILATLDDGGRLDALPFMPEMFAFCGRRFRVYRSAHKTCDTVSKTGGRSMKDAVHLEGARCDGAAHGGCQAACLIFWKEAWLKRVDEGTPAGSGRAATGGCSEQDVVRAARRDADGDPEPRYACQATDLVAATRFLPWWDVRQYVRDVRSGNVPLKELLNGFFFRFTAFAMARLPGYRFWLGLYDRIQALRGGAPYPLIQGRLEKKTPSANLGLRPGDEVDVRSLDEIEETLDRRNRNRGMTFDQEMAPYCGQRRRVLARVERIIDERSGRMVELPNECIILDGVFCRSQYSDRRIGCPRAIYSYWRESWLRRVGPGSD